MEWINEPGIELGLRCFCWIEVCFTEPCGTYCHGDCYNIGCEHYCVPFCNPYF